MPKKHVILHIISPHLPSLPDAASSVQPQLRSRGGSGRRDYGAEVETGTMVRALQDELAEKERTGRLMKDMLDQKTSNINLLKVHHQTELDSQGGIFNSVLDKRESDLQTMGRQVESLEEQLTLLRVEHERLIEDTCIIFSLETARSDTDLLDSLRTVQQYIDDRDADLAQLVKENEALQNEMSTHGANSDDIRDLREALKQTDDEVCARLHVYTHTPSPLRKRSCASS